MFDQDIKSASRKFFADCKLKYGSDSSGGEAETDYDDEASSEVDPNIHQPKLEGDTSPTKEMKGKRRKKKPKDPMKKSKKRKQLNALEMQHCAETGDLPKLLEAANISFEKIAQSKIIEQM